MGIVGDTKLNILKTLKKDPSHGYAIAKEIDISESYIYRHLNDLKDEGLIEVKEEKGRRKVYRLTESGELLVKALE